MAPYRSQRKSLPSKLFRQQKRSQQPLSTETRLRLETLETRLLLAADMAEVVGVVTADLQGDQASSVVVAGATAALYRDNGNGAWDAGDALVQSGAVTDANGEYHFAGVGAGRYFVKITPPAGMHFRPGEDVRAVTISDAEADFVVGQTIDGFASNQRVTASPPLPSSDPSRLTDGDVMGGERDLFVRLTDGDDPFSSVSIVTGAGLMRLASDTTVTGDAKIVWDGVDSSADGVNPTGLGGVDLTSHEGDRMTGIALTVGADHPDSRVTLRVYSDGNNWTEYASIVPESPGGAATKYLVFGFDDSPADRSGSGADFSNVGAIELTFEGVSAVDGQVSLVGLVGNTVKRVNFVTAPQLCLGDHVFNDVNNNGVLDSGEQGIGGVSLNLYDDVDQNNAFTNGVDQLLAATTTDGSGRYKFQDLFPGKYLVQVAEENFSAGGALHGMTTSTGNDPASDPDDNIDGDDNGTALAGLGVWSQSIMLAGGDEPTTDGDADANTNRTVDFGFAGFDLVLDKSVHIGDGSATGPNDELTYTIVVNNDGPSLAEDVQFEDALPPQVAFQSATASNGADVRHSAGKVTADLGDMAPGAAVTLSIVVDVSASATGTLTNEAVVRAPRELNLTNNSDRVSNPVTPEIDLEIDKSDSDDPINSGDAYEYTLRIRNNGPSDATGVTIVDTLPAEGIEFQGASESPASVNGREITFDVGDLESGGSHEVEIRVVVDQAFVGTLLNTAEVSGNETETRYDNNVDDETTRVEPLLSSLSGKVYVDRNDDGVFDVDEQPIADVLVTLTGTDILGNSVTRTDTTDASGMYMFNDLMPGLYNVTETHPTRYRDGKDSIGDNGDGISNAADGLVALDLNDLDDRDADALGDIQIGGGVAATDYNFGELSHGVRPSKADLIVPLAW